MDKWIKLYPKRCKNNKIWEWYTSWHYLSFRAFEDFVRKWQWVLTDISLPKMFSIWLYMYNLFGDLYYSRSLTLFHISHNPHYNQLLISHFPDLSALSIPSDKQKADTHSCIFLRQKHQWNHYGNRTSQENGCKPPFQETCSHCCIHSLYHSLNFTTISTGLSSSFKPSATVFSSPLSSPASRASTRSKASNSMVAQASTSSLNRKSNFSIEG